MSPIEILKGMKDPKQFVLKTLSANSNPMLNNLIRMAKSNDAQGVENFARNLFKEQGRDFEKEFSAFMSNFVNDCVIRAISVAENATWEDTYDDLSKIAKNNGILLDDVNFVEPLLDYRYDRVATCAKTVGDFVETHSMGVYLITMPGHITVVKNGVIFDTFDCSERILRDVWRVL